MTIQLSSRQCVLLLIISIFALKLQGLFSLISGELSKDGWLVLCGFLVFDILLIFIVFRIYKLFPNLTLYEFLCKTTGKIFAKIIMVLLVLYFVAKALIPYKGIHDLFGNVLFEYLPWSSFSILLLLTLMFIIQKGLNNIGRLAEVFFIMIAIGIVGCFVLSVTTPDYSKLLPIFETDVSSIIETGFKYSMWFGDSLLLFMFMGKVDKKLKISTVQIWYFITGLLVVALYVIFYCIYENMSVYEIQGLSAITEYALLGFDIGRIDKILILFSFISTIISTALYLFFASSFFAEVFGTKKNFVFTMIILLMIYIIDIYLYSDIKNLIKMFNNVLSYMGCAMQIVFPIFILSVAEIATLSKKKKVTQNA